MNSPLAKSKPVSSRLSAVNGMDSPIPSPNSWMTTSAGSPFELDTTEASQLRVGLVVLSKAHEFKSQAALCGNGAITFGSEVAVESPHE